MTKSEMFTEFLENLKIDNAELISSRYGEITRALNKQFRNTESKTNHTLQVGSYGRWTGIKGISDLDMLYIMPHTSWNDYKDGEQSKLLDDTKKAIQIRYPNTTVKKDRLVVQVIYQNFKIEVQPVFEQEDKSFKYPDTYNGGSWKITKPREEIKAMKEFVDQKNKNLRKLCKMARSWKNNCGVAMGGLLIDTLAYNFLKSTSDYDNKSTYFYDCLCRDFFKYLSEEPNKDYYLALGSHQRVKVKKKFQQKAKKAYENALEAIDAEKSNCASDKWRKIFGRSFPVLIKQEERTSAFTFKDTEQFIEDLYPIDIKYNLCIECDVFQKGFRETFLSNLLKRNIRLQPQKRLHFYILESDIIGDFSVKWKVLNRGDEAKKRDCIRGAIIDDRGYKHREENTLFRGEHLVECYAIQNNIVIARAKINVPIN